MVERSRRISGGETDLIPQYHRYRHQYPKKVYDEIDSKFREMLKFHEEKCNYPMPLCMDNCPMDGIDLSVKPPVLLNPFQRLKKEMGTKIIVVDPRRTKTARGS